MLNRNTILSLDSQALTPATLRYRVKRHEMPTQERLNDGLLGGGGVGRGAGVGAFQTDR